MATKAAAPARKPEQALVFAWEGTDRKGNRVKGESRAGTIALVRADLRRQGIMPLKVRKKSSSIFTNRKKKITTKDIAIFSRQLATMMSAGVPMVQAFDIVGRGHNNPSMAEMILAIKADVEGGTSLTASLRKHPLYFDDLFCNLVEAGEQAGVLETLLDKIATYKEKTESLKAKIKKALSKRARRRVHEAMSDETPVRDAQRVYANATVLPEHAIVGQRYELVVSSPQGFLRLRTDEHVRVVGFDAPSEHAPFPRPRVVRLAPSPPDVTLEGCTVAGAWLTASLRQSFHREDPALVAAEIGPDPRSVPRGIAVVPSGQTGASMQLPDAFQDTELGGLTRTGTARVKRHRPRALLVKVEVQGYVAPELSGFLSQRIDQSLRRRSPAYDYLRERDDLQPPRVMVLPSGTRRSEEDRRIRELVGGVWVPEVRVVGM